ncbi:hypothetical protein XELAEV_18000456mg [Xenopus laevis]|uniref:Uncharacterized protein n=1 Tax=Xenopus laevis TaxID=8355 RepID=A0A974GYT4_XENLA|nr:hypothetical protein XELAEV_18000456mg [Xenopus laevis]
MGWLYRDAVVSGGKCELEMRYPPDQKCTQSQIRETGHFGPCAVQYGHHLFEIAEEPFIFNLVGPDCQSSRTRWNVNTVDYP